MDVEVDLVEPVGFWTCDVVFLAEKLVPRLYGVECSVAAPSRD